MNPVIKTRRLVLKPNGVQNLLLAHQYSCDADYCRYMYRLPNTDIEQTKSFLTACQNEWQKDNPEYFEFAVYFQDIYVGAVSAYKDENLPNAELGWIFRKEYTGRGFATEAAEALMDFACKQWQLKSFCAHCDTANIPSQRVMEKLGLKNTGKQPRLYSDQRGEAEEFIFIKELESTTSTQASGY